MEHLITNHVSSTRKSSSVRRWSALRLREKEELFVNFTATFVPAIIALAMVGAAIYLMITAPAAPLPDFLGNSVMMILGYYFGIGIAQCHTDKGG
jgi:formate/nitrite transporter FocA (FNT family)